MKIKISSSIIDTITKTCFGMVKRLVRGGLEVAWGVLGVFPRTLTGRIISQKKKILSRLIFLLYNNNNNIDNNNNNNNNNK